MILLRWVPLSSLFLFGNVIFPPLPYGQMDTHPDTHWHTHTHKTCPISVQHLWTSPTAQAGGKHSGLASEQAEHRFKPRNQPKIDKQKTNTQTQRQPVYHLLFPLWNKKNTAGSLENRSGPRWTEAEDGQFNTITWMKMNEVLEMDMEFGRYLWKR